MTNDTFLTIDHPDAFVDFPEPQPTPKGRHTCPYCKGHGEYNLQLNAYRLHSRENTPENRHRFAHFRGACQACYGRGHTYEPVTCLHQWKPVATVGRCLTKYECTTCGVTNVVDSSD